MDLSRYAALFVTESREQLGACGQALLEWERRPTATEPVVTLFRAMHTFKGMAAAMGYANLTELAHRTETVLDLLRSDPSSGREIADLFFRIVDALEQGAGVAVDGGDPKLDFAPLLAELDEASVATAPTGSWAIPVAGAIPPVATPPVAASRLIQVVVAPGATMRGARAMLALRKAEAFGAVSALRPSLAALEQEEFDGRFSFQLAGSAAAAQILAAVRSAGDIVEASIDAAEAERVTEAAGRGRQIRIDLRRLDALMGHVGELVVARARLMELAETSPEPELRAVASRIARVTADLHGEVVQARMTPVWQVFDRFPRVVRDLARQLGKRVRFEVEGEETQLDRAILDDIGEPLIHLLRNAVDHGIELPAERARQGKPEEGQVRLSAASDRTTVLIRVSDDGRGVDRSKVLAEAVQAGLLPAEAGEVPDELLLRVLGRPGFTTAARLSDVSGRGMGMDAVISRLRGLGGVVEIETRMGQGTTFTLRLPMTLAIVRALVARVGDERYAIPLAGIAETVEFHPDRVAALEGREAFVLRERLIPTVRLRERLGVTGPRQPGRQPAVIMQVGERRVAVVVDALVGQQEIVVEPFDAPQGTLPVFSGATILGDGTPALIVDPAALV
ncbi:MAG: chemotaxis protein CheA [Gemmatimonadota bacterium]|nr:chemotaxis protein CheA [Gemmatimonadota bacterium]